MNLACVLLLLLSVTNFCQLCSASWPWEETVSSTPSSSSSLVTSSAWFWDDFFHSSESTSSLETTASASSFSSTSSWDWAWEQETSSITSSSLLSSTTSAEEDWFPTPSSTVSEATSSVPSFDILLMYLYEAFERDHPGIKLKRRDVEESLPKKREVRPNEQA